MDDAQLIEQLISRTSEQPASGTDVAILGPVNALTVFGTDGGVDAIIAKIEAHARAVDTDISTPSGRQALASLAYRIARSKTALDGLGKQLGEGHYTAWKAITSERSRLEKALDALRDDIRKPLTDWEKAERDRVAAHEAALEAICESPRFYTARNNPEDLRTRLAHLEGYPARDWQEFSKRAAIALEQEIAKTKVALAAAEARETEAAETARLAAEKAEQERREREALIAANARREAQELAQKLAEAEARRVANEMAEFAAEARAARVAAEESARQAEAERARIELEKQEADRRADEAEAARVAATAKGRADLEAAAATAEVNRRAAIEQGAASERQRIADAQAKDAAETAKREASRRHRGKVHSEARDALMTATGLLDSEATKVITAIAMGKIPCIKIAY